MPKPQNPDDNASEASYYSYSEYTIPASEVSVNRRWYNRLDNWRQDVSPSTPKNDRHSSSPSHLNLPRTGQDEVESTVSPKESISSRPSPRIMPRMLEPPISMPLLREEPRIMNDGRMDMVRVYDAGNGIEARLHPLVMEDKPTREVSGNRLGLVPDTFDQDVTRIKLPPSQGTFYTEQQARKLHPIQDPYRLPLPTSRGSTMYTRGTQLDRDLPPLPPSQSSHLPPRPPRKPPTATPISESFYSDSQPTDQNHRYRPEGHSGDSALLRLDTILERTDKENVSRQTYRKGTPYPSVRNLDPSETSTEYAGARYDGRRSARGDSESTVERVIERTTQTKLARAVLDNIPTMEDIPEHAPRKRYPDPVPARHISKRVSTIVEEPRRPKTPQVVQPPEAMSVKSRPPSRVEQLENKPRLTKQRSTKIDGDFAPTKITDFTSPEAGTRGQYSQPVSRSVSTPVADGALKETTEKGPDPGASRVSVKVSPVPTPISKSRASTPVPSQAERSKLPRSEKLPDPLELSRKSSRDKEITLSVRQTPENRLRESSHGSVWTDTLLSTPDSRHRRDHSPEHPKDERDHQDHSSSSDERLQREFRRRSPSPPRRRISMQGPAGYMGMNQMVPQQPFPGQGNPSHMIHPPMMPPAGYRTIMPPPPPPRAPIMPLVPRSLPPPIMSPPQAPFPWMGSISPSIASWVSQRPTSGLPAAMVTSNGMNPSMTMRNSMSNLGHNYENIGNAGTRRRIRPMESTRTQRDRSTRSGQRIPSGGRLPNPRLEGVPQSRRVRRNDQAVTVPLRTGVRSRPTVSGPAQRPRPGVTPVTSRRRSSRGNGAKREQRPSRSRNAQNPMDSGATGSNPATTNWVRNILTLNRRPGRGSG